ncbi:MAG: type II toxin-antitoxin system RelE/ParE family toxin [Xenococcaceae cyanobacterium MO_207.B15]|nr:type II toxin-antitoxin system RelE/ParE family toxin [Xenococcaceae cyanobacterium MO_207.B15]
MWKIEWDSKALKEAKKLDRDARKKIIEYLEKRVLANQNPYQFGKPLKGNKAGIWRYRVGNYRILCQIEDKALIVLVIAVGHRKDIYL